MMRFNWDLDFFSSIAIVANTYTFEGIWATLELQVT